MNLKTSNKSKVFIKNIKYVFDFILNNLSYEKDSIILTYGMNFKTYDKPHIHIYMSEDIFEKDNYLKAKIDLEIEKLNLKKNKFLNEKKFMDCTLPILFKDPNVHSGDYIKFYKNNVILNFDLISSVFFMLTRYEEFIADENQLDEHYRFLAKESIAFKNDFLDRPIVDEYLELLRQIINWLGVMCKWKNPFGNNKFAALLTHDVDYVKKYKSLSDIIRPMAKEILQKRSLKGCYNIFEDYMESRKSYRKDPFWTFNYIIESENKYNFDSSFYFITDNEDSYDSDYSIKSEEILDLIKYITLNNNEIGIHPNYNSYKNNNKFSKQVSKLNGVIDETCFGGRQHYLRFDIKKTLDLYAQNNILYDTTLGFADYSGFRCGTSHPFKVYSLTQNKILDLWEIPLIVMEVTYKNKKYMNLSPDEAIKYNKYLINAVAKYNGVFTFLWHNNNLDYEWENWIPVYEETLKYLNEKNVKGISGREIIELIR